MESLSIFHGERSETLKGSESTIHFERSERLKGCWFTNQLEQSDRSERLKGSWSTNHFDAIRIFITQLNGLIENFYSYEFFQLTTVCEVKDLKGTY